MKLFNRRLEALVHLYRVLEQPEKLKLRFQTKAGTNQ
jgi:hypothetical protein